MTIASQTWQRNLVLSAAVAVLVFGLLAALDAPHYIYTGYSRRGNRIVKVEGGSPAAAAGLQPGDELESVNGIPPQSIGDREHRLNTGELWQLAVRRSGAVQTLQLAPTGQPAVEVVRARSRSILGLCLVGFTVGAFITSPGAATMLLAITGLSFGFVMMGAPYIAPGLVRQGLNVAATLAFTIGMVVFVHFLLAFPSRSRFLDRPRALWLLYAPAIVLAIPSVGNVVLPPALRVNVRVMGTLWIGLSSAYILGAVVLLVHRYVSTPRAGRREHGLGLVLGGIAAAAVPFLFFAIAPAVWPPSVEASHAYSPYAAGTFSIVPLAFAAAAVRSGRHSRSSGGGGR